MSEPLLVCASADPDDVAHGVAVALAYHDAPASAQGRSRIFEKRKRQARRVVPHALKWLDANVGSGVVRPSREYAEKECTAAVTLALGWFGAWLLGEAVSLIVSLVVRWYLGGQSRAYRFASQSRRYGQ